MNVLRRIRATPDSRLVARPAAVVALGTVASTLILVSSYFVGFVGVMSPLWNIGFFRHARSSAFANSFWAVVLIAGVFALIVAWLQLGVHVYARPGRSTRLALRASIAWATPLLFSLPLFSRDVFSYIAQARVVAAGLDPYRWGVDSVPGWEEIGVDPLWRSTPTPYGPVSLLIQWLTYQASSPFGYHGWLYGFRLVAVLGFVAAIFFATRIARERGIAPALVLWAAAASPLFLTTFVIGAHNDAIMIALVLAGLHCAQQRHPVASLVLVALAVGVKPVALVALPVIGLIHVGHDANWRRRIGYWAYSLVTCLLILGILGLTINVGMGWLLAVGAPASVVSWFAPTAIVAAAAAGALSLLGVSFESVFAVTKVLGLLLAVAAAGYVLLSRRRMDPLLRLVIAYSALIGLSPVMYGWYLSWPIFIAAGAGLTRTNRARLTIALLAIFFVGKDVVATFNYAANALGVGITITLNNAALILTVGLLVFEYLRHRNDSPLGYFRDAVHAVGLRKRTRDQPTPIG